MYYSESNIKISLGDKVIIDHDVSGIVVCDFDEGICLETYESWLTKEELVGGGYLNSGIMVKTESVGFVHCVEGIVVLTPA